MKKAIVFLLAEQEEDGSWFGRWGTNYIYGTWSVLCALNAAGINHSSNPIRKAVSWIYSKQRADGGWGETGNSYYHDSPNDSLNEFSTASQTAWAVLGLMSVGEVESNSTKLGISFLLELDRDGPKWKEDKFTAVGFPRVFYLRYHGYSAYFPLWALARYNHLMDSNNRCHDWGL